MFFVQKPNLPQGKVCLAAVSATATPYLDTLAGLGVDTVCCPALPGLDLPVQSHADMLLHHLGGPDLVVARGVGWAEDLLRSIGMRVLVSDRVPCAPYPDDVCLNACRIGDVLFGLITALDPVLTYALRQRGVRTIDVKQGYAKCATVVVDEQSIMTEDPSIASAAEEMGLTVLRVRAGDVVLPGYSYGFLGGCCGKIAPDALAFTGSLLTHRDGGKIRRFLSCRGIEPVELDGGILTDIGGILPLACSDASDGVNGYRR